MPFAVRLPRTGWYAESSGNLNVPSGNYVASNAITSVAQPFISQARRFDWLYIEFPSTIVGITRVEVVKRPGYENRFRVSEACDCKKQKTKKKTDT